MRKRTTQQRESALRARALGALLLGAALASSAARARSGSAPPAEPRASRAAEEAWERARREQELILAEPTAAMIGALETALARMGAGGGA